MSSIKHVPPSCGRLAFALTTALVAGPGCDGSGEFVELDGALAAAGQDGDYDPDDQADQLDSALHFRGRSTSAESSLAAMSASPELGDAASAVIRGSSTGIGDGHGGVPGWAHDSVFAYAARNIVEGRDIFRNDTFGNEAFWGDALRLHEAIAGDANGGVGAGISPKAALGLGLKVDVAALPHGLKRHLLKGKVDLDDPATTLELLELDAVIGLKGSFDDQHRIQSLGVTCALCHTQVDDSLAPGIGRRLDGWPNRDLDIGAIVAAAPNLSPITDLLGVDDATLRAVVANWGRGKFDAFVFLDGKATKPDGSSAAVTIPPVFGLNGVGLVTWNGFGSLASWVPLVANVEIHGMGSFADRRLGDPDAYPVADAAGFDRIRNTPDLTTAKMAPLQYYLLSLEAPKPPKHSFDDIAAEAGEELFNGKARCSGCHVPPLYTLPGWNIIPAAVVGVDSFHADRSPAGGYRVPPLRGLFTREGGYFHDGRFASVDEVIEHFDGRFSLALSDDEKYELGQFLRSL